MKKFEACFGASLDETMASYSAEMLDSPVDRIQQRAVLKTLSKTFQREVKAIYEDDPLFAQLCKKLRHLTENARKIILGANRAACRIS